MLQLLAGKLLAWHLLRVTCCFSALKSLMRMPALELIVQGTYQSQDTAGVK